MWKYFVLDELKCKCGECDSTGVEMDDQFMRKIVFIREKLGFPFIVNSAYRCPKHNRTVGETGLTGPHTTGAAMDIRCNGYQAYKILEMAFLIGLKGIGVNQKGSARYIHLDDCSTAKYPRPTLWSY
jgi:zinc D-Ala-D-Ala carboxypeptidase